MFPTLFHLGPLTLRSFGALMALSFLVGIPWAAKRARTIGLDGEIILGMAWLIVVSGVAGARILFALQHPDPFLSDPLEIFRLWSGGLTLYGGLILATLATIFYLRRRTDRPWAYTDTLAPFVCLGQGFTRIGCFLNGCCFGRSCEVPWGVTFPADSYASATLGYPHHLHPSQLYQSLIGFVLFGLLSIAWRRRRFDGEVFWLLVIGEGVARLIADFFRFYEASQETLVAGLRITDSQILSVVVILVGLIGYGIRYRRVAEAAA